MTHHTDLPITPTSAGCTCGEHLHGGVEVVGRFVAEHVDVDVACGVPRRGCAGDGTDATPA